MKVSYWRNYLLSLILGLLYISNTYIAKCESNEKNKSEIEFSEEQKKSKFINDFIKWSKLDTRETLPQPDAILVIGSSSIKKWTTITNDLSPLKIIHRGFGGSTMKDALIMHNFFMRYGVKKIVIYEGDNDLNKDDSNVEKDFIQPLTEFIQKTWEIDKDVEFYLISIKYSPSRMHAKERYSEANQKMKEMAINNPKIHFIDVNSKMLDDASNPRPELFLKDRLHMNENGYKIWTEELKKVLLEKK
ncbi:MAG TPA: GDSL-type esterase/lipase family protein [Victivallales bacterium]|nr:GDSL-type esterase/lipase family protein [Victivallales bacterium]HRR29082.1 GDSL-type esterase/lipase family protein [Victivallales bacterium]